MSTATDRYVVWYDVDDGFGHLDSEWKEFKTYKAALRFAEKHAKDERPAAIDHFIGDSYVG